MPTFLIKEVSDTANEGFRPYGAAAEFWRCKEPEIMLAGPAETGKTRSGLEKLDALLWKYARSQAVIVRKVRSTMAGSVLQTYAMKVLGKDSPVKPYGGEKAEWYDYPNGSRVWVAGIDDPGKALSSERDFIYVNQAEELNKSDWETLLTRATGRAGNAPYAQTMGDANPGPPQHWIKEREAAGKLKLFNSRHEDNPTLFDPLTGQITEQGKRTLSILDGLTGLRYQRLRRGLWVGAEGVVYEDFDPRIHLINQFPIPADWRRIRVIDFGYTNPFVCQWWAMDHDGRMYLYRELYGTKTLVEKWAEEIKRLSAGERFEATIADHDAEDRATLESRGITTQPAHKAVTPGLQAVEARLKVQPDGKPRLFLMKGALVREDRSLKDAEKPTSTQQEFPDYVWAKAKDGKPNKEEPAKVNDHGMDAARYGVAYEDGLGRIKAKMPQGEIRGYQR
jgi:phage terminase large subunit